VAAGNSFRAIAKTLNRAVSTVSQEVARHAGRSGYRAAQADWEAWEWARRPKVCLLARDYLADQLYALRSGLLRRPMHPRRMCPQSLQC